MSIEEFVKKPNPKLGMMFIGDQYTSGEGLLFYSNLHSIKNFNYKKIPITNKNLSYAFFERKYRFSNLIANRSNSFDINWSDFTSNKKQNKGIGDNYFQYLRTVLERILLDDIKTYDNTIYKKYIDLYESNISVDLGPWFVGGRHYYHWQLNTLIVQFPAFFYNSVKLEKDIRYLEDRFKKFEEKNILCGIIIGNTKYYDIVIRNEYLNKKIVNFRYDNNNYDSIHDLLENNLILQIKNDYADLATTPIGSLPSMLGHETIFVNILKFIRKNS